MNPFEAYHNVNKIPILGTALNTAGAGALGYMGAKSFGPKVVDLLTRGLPGEMRAAAIRGAGDRKFAGRMAVLTAVGELLRNLSIKGVFNAEAPIQNIKDRMKGPGYNSRLYDSKTLQKTSLETDLDENLVPTRKMIRAINEDRFLEAFNKLEANTLISEADPLRKGRTSGRKIANTALRAGVGFVPAYMFGKTIAGLAGLPRESLGRIGAVGGIATALYNTGIFGDKT